MIRAEIENEFEAKYATLIKEKKDFILAVGDTTFQPFLDEVQGLKDIVKTDVPVLMLDSGWSDLAKEYGVKKIFATYKKGKFHSYTPSVWKENYYKKYFKLKN